MALSHTRQMPLLPPRARRGIIGPMLEDLDIFRSNGRAAKPVSVALGRELTPADLAMLNVERGTTAPPLKRLAARHHALAKLLASGVKPGTAAVMVGMSGSRVSILQADPGFQELLVFYRENVDAQYEELHSKLAGMSADALETLRERLETAPEDISVGQLMELVKLGADRTGHGPQSSSTQVNVNINVADRLKAARERVKTIEHE